MLVLTRKKDQEIVIGNNVLTIAILGVQGSQVRLGIKGDDRISIHRREIFEKIKKNQKKASHE